MIPALLFKQRKCIRRICSLIHPRLGKPIVRSVTATSIIIFYLLFTVMSYMTAATAGETSLYCLDGSTSAEQ